MSEPGAANASHTRRTAVGRGGVGGTATRGGGGGRYRPRRHVSRSGNRPSRRGKYTVVRPQKQIPSQSPDREGEVVGDFSENYTFVPGASPPGGGGALARPPPSLKVGGSPPPARIARCRGYVICKIFKCAPKRIKIFFFAKCNEVKRYVVSGHLL